MPQLQQSTLDAFRGLDETAQRVALGRMSPEAKQALLGQIKTQPSPAAMGGDPSGKATDPTIDMSPSQLAKYNLIQLGKKLYAGGKGLVQGSAEFLGRLDENPIATVADTGMGIASGLKSAVTAVPQVGYDLYTGNTPQAIDATSNFITQGIPAVLAAKGMTSGAVEATSDMKAPLAEALRTRALNLQDKINPSSSVPLSKMALLKSAIDATRGPRVALYNAMARKLVGGIPFTEVETAAMDELARSHNWGNQDVQTVGAADVSPKLNIPRPGVPSFDQAALDKARAEAALPTNEELQKAVDAQTEAQLAAERAARTPQTPGQPPVRNPLADEFNNPPAPPATSPLVNKWMGVSPKDLKFGADPAGEVIRRKLITDNHTTTLENVTKEKASVQSDLNAQLEKAGTAGVRINAWDTVSQLLDKAKAPIASPTEAAFQNQLNSIGNKILERFPNLDSLTPAQAQALKVELTKDLNYSTVRPPEVTDMLKKMGHEVGVKIKTAVPDSAATYDSWQNLIVAEKGLRNQVAAVKAGRTVKPIR